MWFYRWRKSLSRGSVLLMQKPHGTVAAGLLWLTFTPSLRFVLGCGV
ncbi:hypothetical protein N4Q47_09115 [Riemerella anatipestifer]|nr:hypothetical protein [Riemerella anatipestifer]MCO7354941.1 hypothetical protein [Riemerella anatipestifer]MCT6745941.1 hypothetical protein [Riemerella anatipestifer]MCU7573461.1 hypothetical protein [Riemerella anatipestifer]MCU7604671.1 hypothetical protein [Riemerella anatipestifer]MCW0499323.1 hypothetical protein [Riemerella anatipestifer]